MSYEDKAKQLVQGINKSLYELLEVLGEIDEDDPQNNDNEWTITDDEGGTITLSYKPRTKQLTITRNGLKLVVSNAELKQNIRLVLKKKTS